MTITIEQQLNLQATEIKKHSLSTLFQNNPNRFSEFSLESSGLFLDFSKNHLTPAIFNHLISLAEQKQMPHAIAALFSGQPVNITEQQAALHTALRTPHNQPFMVDGHDTQHAIHQTLAHMEQWVKHIHQNEWPSKNTITDIVNIGIGGAHLGPALACQALKPFSQNQQNVHFLSNIDGQNCAQLLSQLSPQNTLFIISSKSFGTMETLTHAKTAKQWLIKAGLPFEQHLLAVTANMAKAISFGIPKNQILTMGPWVGGRYSLWSAVGLPIALMIGMDHFNALRAGAHHMDQHFAQSPLSQNMPVIMGLLSIWYRNHLNAHSHCILAYAEGLKMLPQYLQQLEMESNGKQVNYEGKNVEYHTAPVIWGGMGSDSQHAFMQMLHQGTELIPVDFIIPVCAHHPLPKYQEMLVGQALSQSEALMRGRQKDQVQRLLKSKGYKNSESNALASHLVIPGNRPSNTLLMESLSPKNLGALLALYEHKTYVESVMWQINPFDQWGVELGKQLAHQLIDHLHWHETAGDHDPSTKGLLAFCQQLYQRESEDVN